MRLSSNSRRIFRFFWNRRSELLDHTLWRQVSRVVRERFDVWDRVPRAMFHDNLALLERRPWNLHVELTNACNANCIFCAYQHQTRRKQVMRDSVFDKALDDYCAMGGGELMLEVVVGDPSLDPRFLERVKAARARPEIGRICTITNGINLHQVGIEDLVMSGISHVQISTSPWDEALYVRMFRSSKYAQMKHNIAELLRVNQAHGSPVDVLIAFRSNIPMRQALTLPDYQAIAHLPHRVEFNVDYDSWTGEISQGDLLDGMHIRPRSRLEKEACYWLYDGPIVFVDGSVGLCGCRDFDANSELVVGNILDADLLSLWTGAVTRGLRQRFRDGQFPEICKKCTTYANLDLYRSSRGIQRAEELRSRMRSAGFVNGAQAPN
jgi:hypothetical protein